MTQEDKQLLLKDLCARLPYGVKVRTPYNDAILRGIVDRKGVKTTIDYTDIVTDKQTYPIRYIKPYLRPISSMTKEEKNEFEDIIGFKVWSDDFDNEFDFMSNEYSYIDKECVVNTFNWLNAHHFDYRGLIEKGLALEALEGMYK